MLSFLMPAEHWYGYYCLWGALLQLGVTYSNGYWRAACLLLLVRRIRFYTSYNSRGEAPKILAGSLQWMQSSGICTILLQRTWHIYWAQNVYTVPGGRTASVSVSELSSARCWSNACRLGSADVEYTWYNLEEARWEIGMKKKKHTTSCQALIRKCDFSILERIQFHHVTTVVYDCSTRQFAGYHTNDATEELLYGSYANLIVTRFKPNNILKTHTRVREGIGPSIKQIPRKWVHMMKRLNQKSLDSTQHRGRLSIFIDESKIRVEKWRARISF